MKIILLFIEKKRNIFFSKPKGFTVIELIMVVAIIAILAGIIVSGVNAYTNKAKGVAFRASVDQFIKAVKLKQNNGEVLPKSMIVKDQKGWAFGSTLFDSEFRAYIADFPKPPFTGQLIYRYYPLWKCSGSSHMLLVNGAKNRAFFSDWTNYTTNQSCYPL